MGSAVSVGAIRANRSLSASAADWDWCGGSAASGWDVPWMDASSPASLLMRGLSPRSMPRSFLTLSSAAISASSSSSSSSSSSKSRPPPAAASSSSSSSEPMRSSSTNSSSSESSSGGAALRLAMVSRSGAVRSRAGGSRAVGCVEEVARTPRGRRTLSWVKMRTLRYQVWFDQKWRSHD